MSLTRARIIKKLTKELAPISFIHAMWEMGSASFDRVDKWSDIDLMIVSDDDKVEETLKEVEKYLLELTELDLKYRLPEPTWHGHAQVFWRMTQASPFLLMDLVVMKRSSTDKFLQYQIHGKPIIDFDKIGIVKDEPVDPSAFSAKLKDRLERLKTSFEFTQVFVIKELKRKNDIHAYSFYVAHTFRPLVMVLRMKYNRYHFDFFTAYLDHELPADVVARLRKLYLIGSLAKLKKAHEEAVQWFREVVNSGVI